MKAILLAGGQGTRLRPLTLHTPKPIVPIFNRPFLYYQIDLLRQIPELDEVILSLNYQPQRIEAIVGGRADLGLTVRYLVEPKPLGTAGAVKYAERYLDDSVVVFNGDVLTQIDLGAVLRLHRERRARATIVLTPVDNPSAYGLVETDAEGNVRQFLEKPDPAAITCNTINAGIYILEPETFDRIPKDTMWSIERSYFPSLVDRHETFVAYIDRGYWIDIGTPANYRQVHRDIMDGRYLAPPFAERRDILTRQPGVGSRESSGRGTWVSPDARIGGRRGARGALFHRRGLPCPEACPSPTVYGPRAWVYDRRRCRGPRLHYLGRHRDRLGVSRAPIRSWAKLPRRPSRRGRTKRGARRWIEGDR